MRVEGADGRTLILYTNIDCLERHMIELAPQDEDVIAEIIKGIRACNRFELPVDKAPELYGFLDELKLIIKMLPSMLNLRKWILISTQDFAAGFKDPLLREAFSIIWLPEFPMSFMLMTLEWVHKKEAGHPGGEIHYN